MGAVYVYVCTFVGRGLEGPSRESKGRGMESLPCTVRQVPVMTHSFCLLSLVFNTPSLFSAPLQAPSSAATCLTTPTA